VMGSHDGAAEAVRVRLLGGFCVSVGSRVVEADGWRRRSAASLVKVLALARGHRLRRDRMLDILWPELDERTAAGNLYRALHFARRAFEPDASRNSARYLALVNGMVSLCPEERLWVDAEEFEQAAARRSRDPAAYRAAIELYAGELLPADSDEEWAQESRDALHESHLVLLVELAALHEERGEPDPAIEALGRVLAEAPTREEAHRALMRLHAAGGDRGRALAQYRRLARALEPGEATRLLHERIRAGDFPAAPAPPFDGPEGPSPPPVPGNLPAPLSSFVGREIEKVEVGRDLSMTRLLTLTGAGARARRAWRWRSPAASPASTPTAYGSWSSPRCRTPSWWRGRWRRLWACASNPDNRSPGRSPPTSGPGTRCLS
jgi:DNA-binding SARP family transcriptional activator